MKRFGCALVLSCLVLVGFGCSDDDTDTCSSGTTRTCSCDAGGQGTQTCSASGSWGPCQCGAVDAALDSAGDAPADGPRPEGATPDTLAPDTLAPDAAAPCYSLSLNGSSDKVTVPHTPDFNFGTGEFTLEAWIKVYNKSGTVFAKTQSSHGYLLAVEGSTSGAGRVFFAVSQCNTGGSWAPFQYALGFVTPASSLPMNSWTHVAVSRQGNAIVVYIDGKKTSVEQKVAAMGFPGTTQGDLTECYYDTNGGLTVGAGNFSNLSYATDPVWKLASPFKGLIGEVRITRKAIYNVTFVPTATLPALPETVLLWHVDEGAGAKLTDASPKLHDGTITGSTWVSEAPGCP
jgi:hypothetical protein